MTNPAGQAPESIRHGTLKLPGLTLHYAEVGSGPAVVLLHGYTDTWRSFRLVLPMLATRCRCLAIDQRGHGDSAYAGGDFTMDAFAEDVIRFVSRLDLAPVTLLGHSMGSFVARKAALRRPELVERLVLAGSGMRTDNHSALAGLQKEVDRHADFMPQSFVDAQLTGVVNRALVPDWFFTENVEAGARIPLRVWQGALAGLGSENHSGQLGRIAQPVLLVAGENEPMFPPSEQEELVGALPRARLELYENCGHYPHWEQPQRFARDVIHFVCG